MAAPEGQCALCLKRGLLQESHLFPAAVYKFMRDPTDDSNVSPVHLTTNKSFQTDKQITEYFLCWDCEQKFSTTGESYVMSECDRQNGKFRLRDRLTTCIAVAEDGKYKIIEVTNVLGDNTDHYLYFAASMFWRFSARSWRCGSAKIGPIKLGPYQEDLRRYLLGEAGFPTNACLIVQVSSDDTMTDVALPPWSGRSEVGRCHRFYMLGLLFTFHLGERVVQSLYDDFALNSRKGKYMVLCPWKDDPLFGHLRSFVKTSQATRNLLDRLPRKTL